MTAFVTGTERVLAAARRAGVAAIVHVSAETAMLCDRSIVGAAESCPRPARPLGSYSRTKELAEERVNAANGRFGYASRESRRSG